MTLIWITFSEVSQIKANCTKIPVAKVTNTCNSSVILKAKSGTEMTGNWGDAVEQLLDMANRLAGQVDQGKAGTATAAALLTEALACEYFHRIKDVKNELQFRQFLMCVTMALALERSKFLEHVSKMEAAEVAKKAADDLLARVTGKIN